MSQSEQISGLQCKNVTDYVEANQYSLDNRPDESRAEVR